MRFLAYSERAFCSLAICSLRISPDLPPLVDLAKACSLRNVSSLAVKTPSRTPESGPRISFAILALVDCSVGATSLGVLESLTTGYSPLAFSSPVRTP